MATKAIAKQKKQTAAKIKQHRKILAVMKDVLKDETFDDVRGDEQLAKAIRARGVFASGNMVRGIRLAANIPTAYERKMRLFEKEAGKK